MEQSLSHRADNCLAGKNIPCVWGSRNGHYCIHKTPSLESFQSQINPVQSTEMLYIFQETCICKMKVSERPKRFEEGNKDVFDDAQCSYSIIYRANGPPLWSSGQSSWLQTQGSRVRFPGTTKKKLWVGNGVHSASWVQTEELLDRKVAALV
jgi:hypothetical protein